MIKTKKAIFIANTKEKVIVTTQLSTGVTTKLDPHTLFTLLNVNFTLIDKKSIYCSKAKLEVTFGNNMHLRTIPNAINVYLTKGYAKKLKEYILDSFPNIEKYSNTNNPSKEERLNSLPFIKLAEYEEPYYDDANVHGYHLDSFIGIIGKNGETIEIPFEKNDKLFAPSNGISAKEFIIGSDFNLFNQDRENLAYRGDIALICTYGKTNNVFEVKLFTTKEINYFGNIIKPCEPKQIAVGILPQKIKYIGYLEELLDEDDLKIAITETTVNNELPW